MDWNVTLTTFGLIFLAELGDKTQLAVLAQTCKHGRPWAVFLGASTALAAVTALGAAGGRVIGQVIPPSALQWGAGLAFIVMGLLIGRQALQGEAEGSASETTCDLTDDRSGEPAAAPICAQSWRTFGSTFGSTFGLLFVAEMGDKTQLAVLSLAGKAASPWPVFIGGGLALTAVTALGVIGGRGLSRIIPQRVLLWISAAAFVAMGVLIGCGVL
jgi:putative Ca2+/H+ antiporter (TMEM165/GDT1 family)